MVIRENDILTLKRCPEWTDARVRAFYGPVTAMPLNAFIKSVGNQNATHEDLYWAVTGVMTPKQRRLWCATMIKKALKTFRDDNDGGDDAKTLVADLDGLESSGAGNVAWKLAAKRAKRAERKERERHGHDVTKRSRMRRIVRVVFEERGAHEAALKVAGMLKQDHSGFGYSVLNKRLRLFLKGF